MRTGFVANESAVYLSRIFVDVGFGDDCAGTCASVVNESDSISKHERVETKLESCYVH